MVVRAMPDARHAKKSNHLDENTMLHKIDVALLKFGSKFLAIIVGFLAVCSLFWTSLVDMAETSDVIGGWKLVCITIASAVAVSCIVVLLYRISNRYSLRQVACVCALISFFIGVGWLTIANTSIEADQNILMAHALLLDRHDYSSIIDFGYIFRYPFQSGFILFDLFWGRLFGFENLYAFRLFNVVLTSIGIFALSYVASLLFKSDRVGRLCGIITVMFFPITFMSMFVYGNTPSLVFGIVSLYFCLKIIDMVANSESGFISYAVRIFSLLLFVILSLWFKPNSQIFVIGIMVITVFCAIRYKSGALSVVIPLIVASYMFSSAVPVSIVSKMIDRDLGSGIPSSAWIAMGMQESPRAPGWYNAFNEDVWAQSGGDFDLANKLSKNSIKDRLECFRSDLPYTANFYARKFLTQWAEPTFQSLWISFARPAEGCGIMADSKLQASFINGKAQKVFEIACDGFQVVVYSAAAYGFWVNEKRSNKSVVSLLPGIVFFGGLLFHMLWEAKSYYVLPYFVMLIPYASFGFAFILKRMARTKKPLS